MATLAELAVKLTTDLSDYTGGLKSASEEASGFAGKVERNWMKITAGGVAAGATLMKLTGDSMEYNASLRAMELQTGMSEQAQRSMIRELTDASFAHEDAARGMERLVQSGIKEEEQFRNLLPVFDTIADALGIDIVDGIEVMDGALSALGIPLEEAGDHMDTLTFLSKNTTADFKQLGKVFRNEQDAIRDLGLNFDDVAVALAAVEAEGIKGPAAVKALQAAMGEAEGDTNAFWAALGVTNETLDAQRLSLEDTAGMTEQLAEINNRSLTWWDELQHSVKGYTLELGSMLEPARDLGPVMMGLGPAIKAVSVAKGFATVAATGLWGALVPLLPIILPLVAIAGILFLAWKNNWFDIQGVTADAIEWITGAFDTFVEALKTAWEWLTDWWSADAETKTEMVQTLFDDVLGWLGGVWDSTIGALREGWAGFSDWWSSDTDTKVGGVGGLFQGWVDAEQGRWSTLTGNLREGWGGFTEWWNSDTDTKVGSVREGWGDFTSWIGENTSGATTTIKEGWGGFTDWLGTNTRTGLDAVLDLFGENRTDVETAVGGMWTAVTGLFQTQTDAAKGILQGSMQIMTGDWEGGVSTLRTTSETALQGVYDVFKGVTDSIKGIFSAFGWTNVGRDIITGIVDGIKAGTKWMVDSAKWAAGQALKAMKGALGIGSPSKVFRDEIGAMLPVGAAIGVEDEMPSAVRRIGAAFDNIVDGIAPVVGFAPDMVGSGAGAPSIHLEVVVQGENATYEGGRQTGRGIIDELRSRGLA